MPGPDTPPTRRDRARVAGVALVALLLVAVSGTVAALTVGPLRSGAGHDAPRYVEETATAGLVQTYGGDDTYDAGGGLAVLDCDGDGRPDVYLPGGANPAALYRNASPTGGALRFTRIASAATDLTAATGAYPIDIDSDGIADLVVLRNGGGSALLRGLGDCRFEAANDAWGIAPTPGNTMAFSATWEGAAALPTLAFGQYVETAGRRRVGLPRQRGSPSERIRHRLCRADAAVAWLLSAVDALQRLGRVGPAGPPGQQRPPLLRRAGRRRRAALAVRTRGAAAGLHGGGRLDAPPAVGHGHRELRPDGRRLPGGLSHEPGREHAPDPRRGAVRARLPWHGPRPRRRGDAAGRRR